MFVKLHMLQNDKEPGEEVWVNLDLIIKIKANLDGHAHLYPMGELDLYVYESPDDIQDLVNGPVPTPDLLEHKTLGYEEAVATYGDPDPWRSDHMGFTDPGLGMGDGAENL